MSTFNNTSNVRDQASQNYDNVKSNKLPDLNENHGIAATGVNDPYTAIPPSVQRNIGSRRQQETGPPVSGNKVGQVTTSNIPPHNNNGQQGEQDLSTHQPREGGIYSNTSASHNDQHGDNSSQHTGGSNNTGLQYTGPDTDVAYLDQTGGGQSAYSNQQNKDTSHSNQQSNNTSQPENIGALGTQSSQSSHHAQDNQGALGVQDTLNNQGHHDTHSRQDPHSQHPQETQRHQDTQYHQNPQHPQGTRVVENPQSNENAPTNVHGNPRVNAGTAAAGAAGAGATANSTPTNSTDKTNTGRHAATGVPPSNPPPSKSDSDKGHESNTAPEGDHGASHHNDAADGNEQEVPGVVDSNGMRHTGEPLHEGLGKVNHHPPKYDEDASKAPQESAKQGADDAKSKPSTGEKIKEGFEKLAGKITGDN